MPTITIDFPKKKELNILKYLSGIDYIKIRYRKKIKENFKKKLINSFKEVELLETGKLEKIPIENYLEELRNEKRKEN
jgi:hypothetical protein